MADVLVKQFLAAKRSAVPLVSIRTADPAATIDSIKAGLNGTAPPLVLWDIIRGVAALNEPGKEAVMAMTKGLEPESLTLPANALIAARNLIPGSILFFSNAHRIISEQGISQAIWNLRDPFKGGAKARMLVLLGPTLDLPSEIANDVIPLDEPLPTLDQLAEIIKRTFKYAKLPEDKLTPEILTKAVDTTCGLPAFPVEQVTAMSLTKDGIDFEMLGEKRRQMIEATPGLSVYRGKESVDGIGGCANAIKFMKRVLAGKLKPRCIVFIDEIEKQLAGSGTDLSGVTTEMNGTMLTWMQDHDASGAIFVGPPGCTKSMLAKAIGNLAGIPTITFDLGAMKGSLVGESNARIRQALKVIAAISQDRAFFIATSNGIGSISPEMQRRFKRGVFFFDLPTFEERKAIWDIYIKKYELTPGKKNWFPEDDKNWTGSDIQQVCEQAWEFDTTPREAADYLVPVYRRMGKRLQQLREEANGQYISASVPGYYRMDFQAEMAELSHGRQVEVAN